MQLFWADMDRADSLSGGASHPERQVLDYVKTNIHITSSGMLPERLLRHTLDFTSADRSPTIPATDPCHRDRAVLRGRARADRGPQGRREALASRPAAPLCGAALIQTRLNSATHSRCNEASPDQRSQVALRCDQVPVAALG
jgi:hypothetical protein